MSLAANAAWPIASRYYCNFGIIKILVAESN